MSLCNEDVAREDLQQLLTIAEGLSDDPQIIAALIIAGALSDVSVSLSYLQND